MTVPYLLSVLYYYLSSTVVTSVCTGLLFGPCAPLFWMMTIPTMLINMLLFLPCKVVSILITGIPFIGADLGLYEIPDELVELLTPEV